MKTLTLVLLLSLLTTAASAADILAGRHKAGLCAACHGDDRSAGMFYSLQLGGRNAELLAAKANNYRQGRQINLMMNLALQPFSEADIADIAAYYESLGGPAVVSSQYPIRGDGGERIPVVP